MLKKEIVRKGIHLGMIIVPLSYYFIIQSPIVMIGILFPIALLFLLIDVVRIEEKKVGHHFMYTFGQLLRSNERIGLTGASYLMASMVIIIAIFPRTIAFYALSFLIIGDTFASIIGISIGHHYLKKSSKTIEGFCGGILANCIYVIAMNHFIINNKLFVKPYQEYPEISIIIIGAVIASITELIDFRINDNITIPLFSGFGMTIIYYFF